MTVLTTTVTINGTEPEKPPRLYWIVQDKTNTVERLVREDGAFWESPENTLLPWAKSIGIKLKKTEDTDEAREFEFTLTAGQEGVTVRPGGEYLADLSVIDNDEALKRALKEVEVYFDTPPELGSPEAARFDRISKLIESYETKHDELA